MINKGEHVQLHLGTGPNSRTAAWSAVAIALAYACVLTVFKWVPVTDALTFAIALWSIFRLLESCTPRARATAIHGITQIIVLSWLFHLWTLGYEGRNAVFGGILPWSDSFGYYNGAVRVAHGLPMLWASKRPVFPAALAVLLKLFGGDLRAALLAFAVFAGWTIALAANALWETHGRRAALFVYAILLLSERVWAGFVQTEHIGLSFGLLGFVLVWQAVATVESNPEKARWFTLSALFSITIALMARTGAFFVLPALALWGARELFPAGTPTSSRLRFLGLASLGMIGGLAVHETVHSLYTSGITFSDYPQIAYGLIHQQDYTYIFDTHPYLWALAPNERTHEAWIILLQDASAHPFVVLTGLARSFTDFFVSGEGLFGFVWRNPDDAILENGAVIRAAFAQHGLAGPVLLWLRALGIYSLANAVAMAALAIAFVVATTIGIVQLYRRQTDGYGILLRYAVAGILLSAPFTPPWVAPAQRIAVATLAFLASAPALALFGQSTGRLAPNNRQLLYVPISLALILILALISMPMAQTPLPACTKADRQVVELYPSTEVHVVTTRSFDLRKKAVADLDYSIRYLRRHERLLTESLVPFLKPGTRYVSAFDACDGNTKILIDDSNLLDLSNPGWQSISTKREAEENVLRVLRKAEAMP